MATTEERKRFGAHLRALRKERDLSLDQLEGELEQRGEQVTASNIGAWERGQYAPRRRSTVATIEEILDAPGQLTPLLGFMSPMLSSAAGTDLDQLKELDPDGYEDVMALLESRLERARRRSG